MNEYNELWHAVRTTLLTGEPLEWQLTNAQRAKIGLPPVEDGWVLAEVPCGLLASTETYIYTDGPRIMRVISSGEHLYAEFCIDASLTEDGRLTPAKEGGKSVPLTAGNLHKRRKVGISLYFEGYPGRMIQVKHHGQRRMLLDLHGNVDELPKDVPGFAQWIDNWCRSK